MVTAKPVFSVKEIETKVAELGERISRDYEGRDLLIISILKGAFMFTADLIKHIRVPMSLDFVIASSYVRETTSGRIELHADIREPIEGRDVLLVEDIIDTGLTLEHLIAMYNERSPRSIKVCGLLNKRARRQADIMVDYRGFDIPDIFVVGYGLDYDNKFRNLPYIAEFRKSQ